MTDSAMTLTEWMEMGRENGWFKTIHPDDLLLQLAYRVGPVTVRMIGKEPSERITVGSFTFDGWPENEHILADWVQRLQTDPDAKPGTEQARSRND